MIYTGSDEIRGVMLGNDEIPAIYVGSEQIYPMTISGFTVRPLTLEYTINGGSKNIRIASEYDWTATTPDSWITLSAASGQSGRTALSVTVGPNQTGDVLSGTVVVTSTDLQHSATIDIIQKVAYEPTGYLVVNKCQPIIETNFNPYLVYTNSNNYMRIEFQNDFTQNDSYPCYLWQAGTSSGGWFSYELDGDQITSYQNLGGNTFRLPDNWNTNGTTSVSIFTYDDWTATATNGAKTTSQTWQLNFANDILKLFPSAEVSTTFYRMKVFDSPSATDPIYDFCPALDGNNTACIYEAVNDTYHYPSGSGTITFVSF